MKRAAAFAAMVALLALPAVAQRGGARGGSGGHTSGGFAGHAGFSGGFAPRYGNFSPRFGGYAPQGIASRGFRPYGRAGSAPGLRAFPGRMPYPGDRYSRLGNAANGRSGFGNDHGHRRPYYRGFNGLPYAYNYGVWPWYAYDIDPWLFAPDWDDSGDNSDQSAQNYANSAPYPDYGQPGPAYGEPEDQYGEPAPEDYAPQQPYPPAGSEQYQPSASVRQPYTGGSAAEPQQAFKIVFKNGDPPETVHNYMLTATTLTVLDRGYRRIPLDWIDVPATQAANRGNGINFQVPGAAN